MMRIVEKKYCWSSFVLGALMMQMSHAEVLICPLTREYVTATKQVIADAWNETCGIELTLEEWERKGYFIMIDQFETEFSHFLIMLDGNNVVGSAGIKLLTDDTCELKRMCVSKPYRHQGWASSMLYKLCEQARARGLKYMRLEVYIPSGQAAAIILYKKFGFYEITPYKESSPEALFMEKIL